MKVCLICHDEFYGRKTDSNCEDCEKKEIRKAVAHYLAQNKKGD